MLLTPSNLSFLIRSSCRLVASHSFVRSFALASFAAHLLPHAPLLALFVTCSFKMCTVTLVMVAAAVAALVAFVLDTDDDAVSASCAGRERMALRCIGCAAGNSECESLACLLRLLLRAPALACRTNKCARTN